MYLYDPSAISYICPSPQTPRQRHFCLVNKRICYSASAILRSPNTPSKFQPQHQIQHHGYPAQVAIIRDHCMCHALSLHHFVPWLIFLFFFYQIPCCLIAGCGYGIYFFVLVPHHESPWQLIGFQLALAMTWISYYMAIFTPAGSPPKDFEPAAGAVKRLVLQMQCLQARTHAPLQNLQNLRA